MGRITMCIEEEFSGKVIGSFDLTEYADRVYNKALEDLCNKLCSNGAIADFMKDYIREKAEELMK